jgi:DNA-binding LytR/AlgR family response regulator
MALKVFIIEDEELAVEKLTRQLNHVAPDIEILGSAASLQTAIDFLSAQSPDLIFSDIHLLDGLSFEIFEKMKTDIPVIFTTAYDQYAIKAFKTNSIDYLLKPVSKNALQEALTKFNRLNHKERSIDFSQLTQSFVLQKPEYKNRFLVQSGDLLKSVPVDEIAYFFADGKYAFMVTKAGNKHFSDSNITQLQAELDPKHFYRINRKYIIHIQSMNRLIQFSKSRVKIELIPPVDGDVIVSVDRASGFKQWLGK